MGKCRRLFAKSMYKASRLSPSSRNLWHWSTRPKLSTTVLSMTAQVRSHVGRHLVDGFLTRFNKIAIQGTPQMAVDKEAICLSRVYSYYPKCNFPLFYV